MMSEDAKKNTDKTNKTRKNPKDLKFKTVHPPSEDGESFWPTNEFTPNGRFGGGGDGPEFHNPKQFSPNKSYNLYDMYTDSERAYKTDWSKIDSVEKLDLLKRLHDEGFKPIPHNLAMEESGEEYRDRFNKELNDGTLDEIPVNRDIVHPKAEINIPKRPAQESHPNTKARSYSDGEGGQKSGSPREPAQMTKEEQKTKFTLSNAINYFKAEQSLATQGPVSLTVYEERKKICGECPHRKTHDKIPDPLGFCTKCGCGANPRARLTNKIKMPQTSCPLNKWDTSTGIYKGVLGKLRHKLTPKSKREKLDYT